MNRLSKILLQILKWLAIIVLSVLILISGLSIVFNPSLSDKTLSDIDQAMNTPLPELVKGKTGIVNSNGVNIWYESILPEQEPKGTILLIMGIANDALAWPGYFIEPLVAKGYRVVRMDNRGTGMSDWLPEWSEGKAYSLKEMAADGIAVLDHIGAEQATIIGVSLGGMIAQTMAIEYPERVSELVSIMSTGNIFDEELPGSDNVFMMQMMAVLVRYGLFTSETSDTKLQIAMRLLLKGEADYKFNSKEIAEAALYTVRKRKGFNFTAARQHMAAIFKSGSRYEGLRKLEIPTLIIHGRLDPIIPFEHGVKMARLIPDAKTLYIKNMGHDIPSVYADQVLNQIFILLDKEPNME